MINLRIKTPKVNENWFQHSKSEIKTIIKQELEIKWNQQKSPSGEKWEPRESEGNWPLLNKTGKMFSSTEIRTGDSLGEIYAKAPSYGLYHQFGMRVPARVWLGVPDSAIPRMADVISKKIIK